MWSRLPRSKFELARAILIIVGTLATLLDFGGALNYSETCYVLPGPLGGCETYCQVELFAPLYPVSAIIVVLGAILAVSGMILNVVSFARQPSRTTNRGDTSQLHGVM